MSQFDFKKTSQMLETPEGRQKFKSKFDEIKSTILGLKHGSPPAIFFGLIDLIKDYPEFKEETDDYLFWSDLYNKIKIDPVEPLSFEKLLKYSMSKDPEEVAIAKRFISKAGAESSFMQLLLTDKSIRYDKKKIIEHISGDNEIEYLGSGVSGVTYKVGNKVFKLIQSRLRFEIPYHPRIMMPQFRRKFEDNSMLEVLNLGKVKSANITDEKLLEIYKELEEAGIVWTDAKKENLVELLEDNDLPDYNLGKDFNLYGFLEDSRYPTENHKALKKGDIVICDLDHLYLKDDPILEVMHIGMPDPIITDYLNRKEAEKRKKLEPNERE